MQRYTVYLYLETTLHVSGGTSNHHQERIQLYLQHLVFVTHDDGWRYHSKHVEQFPDINKLCNVASCWIYIGIYLRCTDPSSPSSSCSGRIRFDSCSLYPQNEIDPSISSSVVLCVFVLLVYIVVLV